jgi:hypothetical protein
MTAKEMNISKFTRRQDYNHVLVLSNVSEDDMKNYISSMFSNSSQGYENIVKQRKYKKSFIMQ